MIFSVHSLYILVYDSLRKCLCVRPRLAKIDREKVGVSMERALECDDSGTEMDQENAQQQGTRKSEPLECSLQGNSSDSAFYHEDSGLKFPTPVYIQRYCSVVEVLCDPRWKGTLKKVVDMGCSEFGFFNHLKRVDCVTEIVAVDVDLYMLESFAWKVDPLISELIQRREEELQVIVMRGSVSEYDACLKDSDAVVCIELIEHLHPIELDKLPFVVFGQVQPRIAVFTTPNSDFNVLFNNPSKRFRHPDHKFEWTRAQFEDWARNIVDRFSYYNVTFIGIGKGPEGTEESHGCCSQMAIFIRDEDKPKAEEIADKKESSYQVVKEVVYEKVRPDTRDELHKAKCKAEYHIHALARDSSFDQPNGDTLIPVSTILRFVDDYFTDEESLMDVLKSHSWNVETNTSGQLCIKYENPCSDNSEFSDEADVDGVHFESCHFSRGPFSGLEMAEAAPRPWQSEPHLQAAFPFAQHYEAPAAESLMFRSVNERQIFGYKSSMSDPLRVDDSGYPNSASVQDMDVTLGSSDDLSPSNEEEEDFEEDDEEVLPRIVIPPPPFVPPAAIPANNHDAVNNNRDYEGNDLGMEVVEIQPQIILPLLPEFPRWLLLMLAEERDEGFADESSSSEED